MLYSHYLGLSRNASSLDLFRDFLKGLCSVSRAKTAGECLTRRHLASIGIIVQIIAIIVVKHSNHSNNNYDNSKKTVSKHSNNCYTSTHNNRKDSYDREAR